MIDSFDKWIEAKTEQTYDEWMEAEAKEQAAPLLAVRTNIPNSTMRRMRSRAVEEIAAIAPSDWVAAGEWARDVLTDSYVHQKTGRRVSMRAICAANNIHEIAELMAKAVTEPVPLPPHY